jgi:hypothetical protein
MPRGIAWWVKKLEKLKVLSLIRNFIYLAKNNKRQYEQFFCSIIYSCWRTNNSKEAKLEIVLSYKNKRVKIYFSQILFMYENLFENIKRKIFFEHQEIG